MKKRRPMWTCASKRCLLKPAKKDGLCWYHAKLMAGLLEPVVPTLYDRKVLDGVLKRELARLEAEAS